jgi:hypothetical protein
MRQKGARGVLGLWPKALGDLAVTALAEHLGGITMSRSRLIRWSGLAAIIGSSLWLTFGVLQTGLGLFWYSVLHLYDQGPPPAFVLSYPVIWIFFVLGLIGLHTRMAIRPRWLGRICFAIAFGGMVMLLLGNTGMNYIWSQNSGIGHDLSAPQLPIMQFDTILYSMAFAGYLVLGAGMALYGVVGVATHALPKHNTWVLWMGVLAGLEYFFTDMGAPAILRNTGTPGILVMAAGGLAFFLVWTIGWINLGHLLWSEQLEAAAPPATSTSAFPAV